MDDATDQSMSDGIRKLNEYVQSDSPAEETAGQGSPAVKEENEGSPSDASADAASEQFGVFKQDVPVRVVPYVPGAKSKRLGRPRNAGAELDAQANIIADNNIKESTVSKFRLNGAPVAGPGSRGGKGDKVPQGKVTEKRRPSDEAPDKARQKQATLNLGSGGLKLVDDEGSSVILDHPRKRTKTDRDKGYDVFAHTQKNGAKPPAKKKKEPEPVAGSSSFGSVSRTGLVPRVENKLCRQLPGPVVPLHYDLYDDAVIKLATAKDAGPFTALAAGYPVTPAPYAGDIVYILEFLNKFKSVVNIDNLSPQSFEIGLSLAGAAEFGDGFVSKDMIQLFMRLLALVLNRKRDVTSVSSAILELKPLTAQFGFPEEWQTTTKITPPTDPDAAEPVDPAHPTIHIESPPSFFVREITYNPFYTSEFEEQGLQALEPADRLVMLRTLVQWAMGHSESIKAALNDYANFEMSGDKDTLYAARVVHSGVAGAIAASTDAQVKLGRRKPEEAEKFVDPCSNPLDYGLRLRTVEQYAGDGGAAIGRFYLCRMPDETNGGLASVETMEHVWEDPKDTVVKGRTGSFKLYVQDVHAMLESAYTSEGVEFNETGSEVTPEPVEPAKPGSWWFEVACNGTQLKKFVAHLAEVLAALEEKGPAAKSASQLLTAASSSASAVSSYTSSILHLHQYLSNTLPVVLRQEEMC
ncbi:hypothetical protein DICA4_F03818 [Diutina catenulata]